MLPEGPLTSEVAVAEVPATLRTRQDPTARSGSSPDADSTPDDPLRRWPRWVVRPLVIYLASRVVTWTTLVMVSVITHQGLLDEVDRWDGQWFIRAAADGWPRHLPLNQGHVARSTIAFFPLFPLSIRWLSDLTGLSLLGAGITIATVTGGLAMVAIWALVRHYTDQRAADRATLLVAMFPGSFVLSLVYSEGFAITFLALGLLALMRRRWLLAGLLGLLASATTPVALAFEVSCLWCAYCEVTGGRNWRSLAAPLLAPLGFLSYQGWIWRHTGNLAAWRMTERGGWKSYPSIAYPVHTMAIFLRDPIATNKTDDLLFVGTVLAIVGAVVAIRSRMPMPMLLYGLSAAALGLISAPIGLRPRFVLLAFPLIIAVGTWLRGRAYATVLALSVGLLIGLTAFEVCSYRVFP